MKWNGHMPEQATRKLREADAMLATGKTIGQVARASGIGEQTFHLWRARYGGGKTLKAGARARPGGPTGGCPICCPYPAWADNWPTAGA